MNISIEGRQNYLYVNVSGNYEINKAIEQIDVVISAVITHKVYKVLIDYRNLNKISQLKTDNYIFSATVADRIGLYADIMYEHPRIAYLGLEGKIDSGYGQKVAAEYGFYNVKSFIDIDDAFKWLKVTHSFESPVQKESA